jgi:spore photoproduct lyase
MLNTKAKTQNKSKVWLPKQVLFTPAALQEEWGQQIYERVLSLGLAIEKLPNNRIIGIKGATLQETYNLAKRTLAVTVAPPSAFKLQPIPPSADWQFHLAEGCPAHCQYCYLAGSLQGPPIVRVFANLPSILSNLQNYFKQNEQTFEVSCYTDPLSLEHLTGSLSGCIKYFATLQTASLRWVTKFAAIEPLINIDHNGRTRCRLSLNAAPISEHMESGTAKIIERINALRQLALPKEQGGGGYKVGVVLAPIMAIEDWQEYYLSLLNNIAEALNFDCDLTFELITHRFTPASKRVLQSWYPNTSLNMNEQERSTKRNKFGGLKYVYKSDTMTQLKTFFHQQIGVLFPKAQILYWT